LVIQVMAGTWTSNNFLYKPATGARGADEKAKFDSGLNRVDSRLANEKWLNDALYNGDLGTAITTIGSAKTVLSIPAGNWPIAANLTVPANLTLKLTHGAVLTIATGQTLTINGSLEAGRYQIFSGTGTGKVSGLKTVYPEWFGAVGDGSTDDTLALNLTATACVSGGVIYLAPATYKTTGWLITKTVSLVADAPYQFMGSSAVTLKAAGAQPYVLKIQGVYGDNPGSAFLHPLLKNINIDANNQAISDAAFIMEFCNLARLEGCSFQNANGHGVRLRTCWEIRIIDPWISNCGTINTGSAFFIDGPTPFIAMHGTNNLRIAGGTWGANRGRWIDVSPLANLDATWIEGNKFELDNSTTPNTSPTDVIHLGAASRTMVLNNTFAGFGLASDNYANLIYLNGDPANNVYGSPTNRVSGNRAMAYNPSSGAINGLYLGAYAPTCEEDNNTFVSSSGEICPNVNVSQYPQLINRTWRNQSSSLFPNNPLPDRELAGFLSIHKVSRGTYAKPFVTDSNCVNNSQTVLQLTSANQVNPDICTQLDLSRWVGYNATNLIVRVRMRLDAAGSATVYVNPTATGAWNGVSATVNSTSWTWYSFTCPLANITPTNHLMDVFFWAVVSGTPNLLVDGFEFSTS
jgi:hypothetical protein